MEKDAKMSIIKYIRHMEPIQETPNLTKSLERGNRKMQYENYEVSISWS